MNKYLWITLSIIVLLIIFNKKVMGLGSMVKKFVIRNDSQGLGKFGAMRDGHLHQGLDLKVEKGEIIKAPFDLEYSYTGQVYSDDKKYLASEYKTSFGKFRVMYMIPITSKKVFKVGEPIGTAQDISEKWGSNMIPHIHVETWVNGKPVNPEKYV